MTELPRQQGVGIIEVMLSLAILLFAAMAMSQLQTSSVVSAQASSVHFSIDHLSSEMLDILRANSTDAAAGSYNFDGSDSSSVPANAGAVEWNTRVSETIPTGYGIVACTTDVCDVSISWIEEVDGTDHRQLFRTRTPL